MIRLFLFLALALLLTGYALWVYRRLELPVRGGRWLASLRAASLLLILLLLFDVRIPGAAVGGAPRWALLDASRSMSADDGRAWSDALERARSLEAEGWTVVRFSGGSLDSDSLAGAPVGVRSLLALALERAAEAGATRVTVISDMRLEDPVQASGALETLPVAVELQPVGGGGPNAGIAAFRVPDVPRPRDPPRASVEVHGEGVDSVRLEIREEGRLVAATAVPVPRSGTVAAVELDLPPAAEEGLVRYTATVAVEGDVFGDDDGAVTHANVGHEAGALVLLSLRPDWEPRYLLPVLGQVTGLSTTGLLRAGPDRFLPMGPAMERGPPRDSTAARRAVVAAALLVVHGLDATADPWVRRALDDAGRALVFPADARGARMGGVEAGAGRPGEWYVSSEIPPSPMAGALAGVGFQGLPPLSGALTLTTEPEGFVPLRAQLRGAGQGVPVLILGAGGTGRRAVGLARDYWRWASRGGAALEAYRRLWSGVAGWLLAEEATTAGAETRPLRRVVPRGQAVSFSVPANDTVRLRVSGEDSLTAIDTTLSGGVHSLGPLAPGLYRYRVEGSRTEEPRAGRFDVETRVDEMAFPVRDLRAAGQPSGSDAERSVGTPLRTSPWPYLLLLALLSAEWVGRRRVGLR